MRQSDTKTIIGALQALAAGIVADDMVVNACLIEAADQLQSLRAEVERLRAERRWIPVEEQLPEIGTRALTMWPNGTISVEWRLNTKSGWSSGANITHWMPLPPLPDHIPDAEKKEAQP